MENKTDVTFVRAINDGVVVEGFVPSMNSRIRVFMSLHDRDCEYLDLEDNVLDYSIITEETEPAFYEQVATLMDEGYQLPEVQVLVKEL